MNFKQAKKEAIENGKPIKMRSWGGYWKWENGTFIMYCKDGEIIDIRQTNDVSYTLDNILSDDWIIATKDNCPVLGGNLSLGFKDAIKYFEKGKKMARSVWTNGEYVYLNVQEDGLNEFKKLVKYDGVRREYLPTYDDIIANDWKFA